MAVVQTSRTVVNVTTDQNLVDGSDYILQNTGYHPIFMQEAAAEPAAASEDWEMLAGSKRQNDVTRIGYTADTSLGLYVFSDYGSTLAVTES